MNHRVRPDCRLCNSSRLEKVLDLGTTPLANELPAFPQIDQEQFPLYLAQCGGCGHVQLPVVVDPERLFRDYVYVSGTSPVFVSHFERYAEELRRHHLDEGDLVVEIGSNDGTLLCALATTGVRVLGVDPAKDIAAAATASGVETWPEFFTAETAKRIVDQRGFAQVVIANNVFAHADDLRGIVDGVKAVLEPGGLFVFEVSYLPDVLLKTLLDTIYHEHLSYHSLGPLLGFFARAGMSVVDACWVPTHGGSIRVYVQNSKARAPTDRCWALVGNETALLGFGGGFRAPFDGFNARIDDRKTELRRLLRGAKMGGKTVAGYGAPAKATTLLYAFDLQHGVLDYVVDDNPLKQGRYLPGTGIPVFPSSAIGDSKPDYVVVFAWNFAASILEKLKAYRDAGGKVVVPLPKVTVYD